MRYTNFVIAFVSFMYPATVEAGQSMSLDDAVNQVRKSAGKPQFCKADDLSSAANEHMQDWAALNYQGAPSEPVLNKILSRGVKALDAKAITVVVSSNSEFGTSLSATDYNELFSGTTYTHMATLSKQNGSKIAWLVVLAKVKDSSPCKNLPAGNIKPFDLLNLVREMNSQKALCEIPASSVTSKTTASDLAQLGFSSSSVKLNKFEVPTGYFPNRDILKFINDIKGEATHGAVVLTRQNFMSSGRWVDEYTLALGSSSDPSKGCQLSPPGQSTSTSQSAKSTSSSSSTAVASSTTPSPSATTSSTTSPSSGSIEDMINQARKDAGKPQYCKAEDLTSAANEHMQDWAALNYQGAPSEPVLNKILSRGVKALDAKAITVMIPSNGAFAGALSATDRTEIASGSTYTHMGTFSKQNGSQIALVVVLAKVKDSSPCKNLSAGNIKPFDLLNLVREMNSQKALCEIPASSVTSKTTASDLAQLGFSSGSVKLNKFEVPTGYFPNRDILKFINDIKGEVTHGAVALTRQNFMSSGRWVDEYTLALASSSDPSKGCQLSPSGQSTSSAATTSPSSTTLAPTSTTLPLMSSSSTRIPTSSSLVSSSSARTPTSSSIKPSQMPTPMTSTSLGMTSSAAPAIAKTTGSSMASAVAPFSASKTFATSMSIPTTSASPTATKGIPTTSIRSTKGSSPSPKTMQRYPTPAQGPAIQSAYPSSSGPGQTYAAGPASGGQVAQPDQLPSSHEQQPQQQQQQYGQYQGGQQMQMSDGQGVSQGPAGQYKQQVQQSTGQAPPQGSIGQAPSQDFTGQASSQGSTGQSQGPAGQAPSQSNMFSSDQSQAGQQMQSQGGQNATQGSAVQPDNAFKQGTADNQTGAYPDAKKSKKRHRGCVEVIEYASIPCEQVPKAYDYGKLMTELAKDPKDTKMFICIGTVCYRYSEVLKRQMSPNQ